MRKTEQLAFVTLGEIKELKKRYDNLKEYL